MKLIREKYRKLKPTIEHLADEVVITRIFLERPQYFYFHGCPRISVENF